MPSCGASRPIRVSINIGDVIDGAPNSPLPTPAEQAVRFCQIPSSLFLTIPPARPPSHLCHHRQYHLLRPASFQAPLCRDLQPMPSTLPAPRQATHSLLAWRHQNVELCSLL